ncbi:MAG: hypothetical protein ACUVTL_11340 [Thermoproteota archaeon]
MDLGIDIEKVLEKAKVAMAYGQMEEAARCFSMAANYFRIVGDLQSYLSRKRLAAECFLRAAKTYLNEGDVSKGFMNYGSALNCFRELEDQRSSEACIEEMTRCISDKVFYQMDLQVGRKIAKFLLEIGDYARAARYLENLGVRALEKGKRSLNALFLSLAAFCYDKQGMYGRAAKSHEMAAESYVSLENFYEASSELVHAVLHRIVLKDFSGAYASAIKAKELCIVGRIDEIWHRKLVEVCMHMASKDYNSALAIWRNIRRKFRPSFVLKVDEAIKVSHHASKSPNLSNDHDR